MLQEVEYIIRYANYRKRKELVSDGENFALNEFLSKKTHLETFGKTFHVVEMYHNRMH